MWAISIIIGSPILVGINQIELEHNGTAHDMTECRFYSADWIIYRCVCVCACVCVCGVCVVCVCMRLCVCVKAADTDIFISSSSLGSFYIPCLIMLILYYRIFKVLNKRSKSLFRNRNFADVSSKVTSTTNNNPQIRYPTAMETIQESDARESSASHTLGRKNFVISP